jgi:hypothetical protein
LHAYWAKAEWLDSRAVANMLIHTATGAISCFGASVAVMQADGKPYLEKRFDCRAMVHSSLQAAVRTM